MRRRSTLPHALGTIALALGCLGGCGSKEPKKDKPRIERMASIATGAPLLVSMPSGRTDVFLIGSDGQVWQSICRKGCDKRENFTDWSRQPGRPPGGITSDPGGVAWSNERIDLFVRGAYGNVWHQTWADGVWYGWEDADGVIGSSPIAMSTTPGTLHLFALAGNALWHRFCVANDTLPACRGTHWSRWIPDPGAPPVAMLSAGSSVASTAGVVDIALKGGDGAPWFQRWASSYWIGWRSLGGQLGSSPTLVPALGRLEIYALDTEGSLIRAFVDSPDAALVWSNTGLKMSGEPRGAWLADVARVLLVSRVPGSHAFDVVSCAQGGDCVRSN